MILAKLATGGMAELFLAKNASGAGIERYVVLKRVLSHRAHDASFVTMFLDEARLAAQLRHPNIAQVYDTGVLGDSYFFTMEYVHGETVREILHRSYERDQKIPLPCVLTIASHAAAGLHHAHERTGLDGEPLGIVHRDVSPSNLMVSYEGHVKVVDFGVAKASLRRSETQSGTVKGKISYLSPEQCRGKVIDRRSDLFSLGIVMWEMLASDRLFKRQTDYENMEAIVKEDAPSLVGRRPDLPREIDAMVARLLAKDPDARYQSAGEVVDAIEQIAVSAGLSLSTTSLARFMLDLFGARREPWLEMKARDVKTEAVTVTASVGAALSELTDAQLASVPDLQQHHPRDWPEGSPGPLDDASTTTEPLRGVPVTAPARDPVPLEPIARASRRGWIVLAGGATIALVAVVLVVLRVHGGEAVPRDAAALAVVAPPPPVAPPAVAPPPPPAVAPAVAPPVDAALAVESAPAPVDGAAVEPAHPAAAIHHRASPADELARAVRADRPAEVVALCAGNARLAAQSLVTCALAACHVRDAARARHWIDAMPAARQDDLVAACREAGTMLEVAAPRPPPPKPPAPKPGEKPTEEECNANPMLCRGSR